MPLDEEIRRSTEKAWQYTLSNAKTLKFQGYEVCYFPLFFQENPMPPPSEIDSCATAIGISVLSAKMSPLNTDELEVIRKCCRLLTMMKGTSGGWPSLVPLTRAIKIEKMEGTINDTFFALKALFDAGVPTFRTDIIDIPVNEQMRIISDGISWLLKNRIRQAWYYIEKEFILPEALENAIPAILPTSNVLFLFSQAKEIVRKFCEELEKHVEIDYSAQIRNYKELLNEINLAYSEAIEWLRMIQNKDGGYGNFPGSESLVTNTALALRALLTDNSEESMRKAMNSLRWMLKLRFIIFRRLNKLPDKDIFENYDQIWVCKDNEGTTQVRRLIVHEKYAMGLLLQVLSEVANKEWIIKGKKERLINKFNFFERVKYRMLLGQCVKGLLKMQEKTGRLSGAFKGYRHVPLAYPIYSIQESINGLSSVLKSYKTAFRFVEVKYLFAGFLIILSSVLTAWGISTYFGFNLWKELLLTITVTAIGTAILYGLKTAWQAFKK